MQVLKLGWYTPIIGMPIKHAKDWNWFEDAREKQGINQSNYLQNYLKEKENEIYSIIRISGISGGISHYELAARVKLDRKNLRPYVKKLIKKGLIRKGRGLQGKYFPTKEPYKDPLLNAFILGHDFDFNLLKKDDLVLTEKIQTYPIYKDFRGYKRYYEPKFTKIDQLERSLFETSNRLGAFVTFAVIQAMNADNYLDTMLSADEVDKVAEEWVRTAISQILSSLLNHFRNMIYGAIRQYPTGYKAQKEYVEQSPRFRLNRNVMDQVLTAFNDLYPLLGFELGEIIRTLPKTSNMYKHDIEVMQKRLEQQQQTCDHEWGEKVEMGINRYIRQCIKCHKTQKVKSNDVRFEKNNSVHGLH